MNAIQLDNSIPRTYSNNGQHAEQIARYTLTGKIEKADNKPFTVGGDVDDIQIKSARATICKGTDLDAHIAKDGAKRYGYVVSDFSLIYNERTRVSRICERIRNSHAREWKEWRNGKNPTQTRNGSPPGMAQSPALSYRSAGKSPALMS